MALWWEPSWYFFSTASAGMILDQLKFADRYCGMTDGIAAALRYLRTTDFTTMENGRFFIDGDTLIANVNRYQTRLPADALWESHRKYIDVQYVVTGEERLGWVALEQAPAVQAEYNADHDVIFYEAGNDSLPFRAGEFAILYPDDVHAPGLAFDFKTPSDVLKVVMKVAI